MNAELVWILRGQDLHQCQVLAQRGKTLEVSFPDGKVRRVRPEDCFAEIHEAMLALLPDGEGFTVAL